MNGKFYIGKHITTHLNDSYLGSGKILKNAIKLYGVENFTKEILFTFDNELDMNTKEIDIVTEELVCDSMCYNIVLGGSGGKIVLYPDHPKYDDVRGKISAARIGQRHWTNGISDTISTTCPGTGWIIGRTKVSGITASDNTKSKMRTTRSNGACSWWNDGQHNKRMVESPGPEWKRGRLMSSSLYAKFCKKQ